MVNSKPEMLKRLFRVRKGKAARGLKLINAQKPHFCTLSLFQSSTALHAKEALRLLAIFFLLTLSPITLVLAAFLFTSTFAPLIIFPFLVTFNVCAPLPQSFYCGRFSLAFLSLSSVLLLFFSQVHVVV